MKDDIDKALTVIDACGKGDAPRPTNLRRYRKNYDDIFRKDSRQVKEENDLTPKPCGVSVSVSR